MKTLIINGSPRKEGDTVYMASLLEQYLPGECETVYLFEEEIKPCTDCRHCRKERGCSLGEDFDPLAQRIQMADIVVIASPIWFGSLPGPFLSAMSRLQTYFSARIFRGEGAVFWKKKGAILLSGGGSGGAEGALRTAGILLREMGVEGEIPKVLTLDTDHLPANEDAVLEEKIKELAKSLCQ